MKLLIKNGRVVDPASGRDETTDVLISGDKIVAVGKNLGAKGAETIDARGLVVTPGFIDMHVHLREPGGEDKETIATGTRSAAMGGFTAVFPMANTAPVIDTAGMVDFVIKKAEESAVTRVYPIAAVTKGQAGQELVEMAELLDSGATAFSDDGKFVANSGVMRRALEYARMFGIPIISHAEESSLTAGGMMNEGRVATRLGLRGIPAKAEEIAVARELALAELTRGRVHIAHVSTKEAVELVRRAKQRGIQVTAETAPHYFCLTEEAVAEFDTNAKVNPPLRTTEDVAAIKEGLKDGTIDVIATDHAPHTQLDKESEFGAAPFGMVGLETALPLIITHLVDAGVLSLIEAVTKITFNPARIMGIPGGKLQKGAPADITIFDPRKRVTVNVGKFQSRSRNSPFHGHKLRGRVEYVIVDGKVQMEKGSLVE